MIAQLKKLIQRAWELEQISKDSNWPGEKLLALKKEFQEFPDEKISRWAKHLSPQMTLKHFQSLIVPLERELQKNPSDEDFLITTLDKEYSEAQLQKIPLHLALDNWRSAFNVGSLFRTADGLGIEHLHLCGYTATPENRAVQKTALGSDKCVSWSYSEKTLSKLEKLKSEGFYLIAFETSTKAKKLEDNFPRTKSVLLFGNERFGLNPEEIKACDEIRNIPMQGMKNSLNVSVCAALAIYEWKKQWNKQ